MAISEDILSKLNLDATKQNLELKGHYDLSKLLFTEDLVLEKAGTLICGDNLFAIFVDLSVIPETKEDIMQAISDEFKFENKYFCGKRLFKEMSDKNQLCYLCNEKTKDVYIGFAEKEIIEHRIEKNIKCSMVEISNAFSLIIPYKWARVA